MAWHPQKVTLLVSVLVGSAMIGAFQYIGFGGGAGFEEGDELEVVAQTAWSTQSTIQYAYVDLPAGDSRALVASFRPVPPHLCTAIGGLDRPSRLIRTAAGGSESKRCDRKGSQRAQEFGLEMQRNLSSFDRGKGVTWTGPSTVPGGWPDIISPAFIDSIKSTECDRGGLSHRPCGRFHGWNSGV